MSTNCQTRFLDFANVFKAFIGTNYLSLPYGLLLSGLGCGILTILVVALFTDYSCILMVKCKYLLIDSLCADIANEKGPGDDVATRKTISRLRARMMMYLDYGDIVLLTFGKWGLYVVNFCIIVTQTGFCMNYFIVIGSTIQTLFPLNVVNLTFPSQNLTFVVDDNVTQETPSSPLEEAHYLPEISTAPPLQLLVLLPLPLLVLFTYFRTVRQLSIISVIANTCACLGFLGVTIYLMADFELSEDLHAWLPSGILVFVGQVTGAYEAVALILPIEASMVGDWELFPCFLHCAVALMTFIIAVTATLGYLSFGPTTQQIILLNLPRGEPFTVAVNVLVVVGIACTYPLMIVPVIQIIENSLFGKKKGMANTQPIVKEVQPGNEETPLVSSDENDLDVSSDDGDLEISIARHIPDEIPAWKRNILRTIVPVLICGLAIVLRNVLVYSLAFVGALGSCPLAYIIPSVLFMRLNKEKITKWEILLNVLIVIFGLVFGVVGVITAFINILEKA